MRTPAKRLCPKDTGPRITFGIFATLTGLLGEAPSPGGCL